MKNPNSQLNILVETKISNEHPMRKLKEKFVNQIRISVVPNEFVRTYEFNFMIVDDFGFRFESDRKSHAAIASFYDNDQRKMIGTLKEIFLSLDSESQTLD